MDRAVNSGTPIRYDITSCLIHCYIPQPGDKALFADDGYPINQNVCRLAVASVCPNQYCRLWGMLSTYRGSSHIQHRKILTSP